MRLASVALPVALVLSAGLTAQEKPAPPPVFRSDVSLVLLPVFVIDRTARPFAD